ncbi:MAG: hypothetical protein U0452_09475 [Anaerolineae bacterium]
MSSHFEQARIGQLLSDYAPQAAPQLALDFGDFLSLLWRFDQCVSLPVHARYYRSCYLALAAALEIEDTPLGRLVTTVAPGFAYDQIPNLPYRLGGRLVDAHDRKAATLQLIALRRDILRIGTYQETWSGGFPGHGLQDTELRERVFAVLFTALQGQFGNFARLLLVVDIVLGNLLLGVDLRKEFALFDLVMDYGYPDPASRTVRREYRSEKRA